MTVPERTADGGPHRDPAGWEPIVGAIGPKVREVRQQLGLSLQQLAARSDVSAAAIHKVERGDMVPTITTLLKLSGALGRPIAYFVDDAGHSAPVAVHVRAADRPAPPADWASSAEGVTAEGIAEPSELLRGGAVLAVVEPHGTSGDTRPLRPGEEMMMVLEGELQVEVAGERYLVRAGDTLHYPTDRPHEWRNPGPEPARAVWWMLRC
ncbi:cupin domain-containing protein [Pseudonocardia bannensis]|uniref:Cupin domain-containing protein n=1 Tax=Pseudonocardia bannensis TaxID=630973 RepID=A0A848DGW5_9PSEU|nr:cupin domain-containing protein [Pseudonocardia bannensis]NMH91887.1 cupin domain-containing protein [Pseudonocardia bannensis]